VSSGALRTARPIGAFAVARNPGRCSARLCDERESWMTNMTIRRIILAVGILAALFFAGRSFKQGYTVRTSANASPPEVTFLNLPSTTSRIGFFRDGVNYFAEFSLSESEFRQVFAQFEFRELSNQWTEVTPKKFGDPKLFERHSNMQPLVVTNGLRYQKRFSNGGGYNIIFDRAQSRAYYDFAKR
jgi:hypothetical protein